MENETVVVVDWPVPVLENDLSHLFLSFDDVAAAIILMMVLALFGFIINRLILFVPSFIKSFLSYKHTLADRDGLDKKELGLKTFIDRWFNL